MKLALGMGDLAAQDPGLRFLDDLAGQFLQELVRFEAQ